MLMNNKLNHILDITFLISFSSGIILSFISIGCDYLRWNLNLVCLVISIITSFLIFFFNIHQLKKHLMVLFTGIITAVTLILYMAYFYHPKVAETSHYVVRHIPDGLIFNIDPGHFCLYEKDGIWEKYHSILSSDGFCYELNDFKEYEKWSVVSYCLEVNKKKWTEVSADNLKSYFIAPIDKQTSKQYKKQIDSLKVNLNATVTELY